MGEKRYVDLREFGLPDDQPMRRSADSAEVAQMMSDLRQRGLCQALTVTAADNGFTVVDGCLRVHALQSLREKDYEMLPCGTALTKIPVHVCSVMEAYAAALKDNSAIRPVGAAEQCRWLQVVRRYADCNSVAVELGLINDQEEQAKPQHRWGWAGVVALAVNTSHENARRLVRCAEYLPESVVGRLIGDKTESVRTLSDIRDCAAHEGIDPDVAFDRVVNAKKHTKYQGNQTAKHTSIADEIARLGPDSVYELGVILHQKLPEETRKKLLAGLRRQRPSGRRRTGAGTGEGETGPVAGSEAVRRVSERLQRVFNHREDVRIKTIAAKAGLAPSTVSDVYNHPEKGKCWPTLEKLKRTLEHYESNMDSHVATGCQGRSPGASP